MNKVFKTLKSDKDIQDFKDSKFIYDGLTDQEKKWFGNHYIDSPYNVYRKIIYTKDTSTPVAFIELTDTGMLYDDENINDVLLSLAVDKNFRGKGLAKYLIKDTFKWFKESEYESMTYVVRYGNESSEILAKKCGFVYFWDNKKDKEKIYIITNPNKLKLLNESFRRIPLFLTLPKIPVGCTFIKDLGDGSAYFYDPEVNMCTRTLSNTEERIFKI